MSEDRVPLDPKVKSIADALAESRGPMSTDKMVEVSETLKGLDPARAEQAATHLVAIGLKLFKTDGESALEVIAQLYVLATLALGEQGAAQAFERAVNYGSVTGETSRTAGMKASEDKPKLEVKGKVRKGLRRD